MWRAFCLYSIAAEGGSSEPATGRSRFGEEGKKRATSELIAASKEGRERVLKDDWLSRPGITISARIGRPWAFLPLRSVRRRLVANRSLSISSY
jgi:hypothetical protein